MQKALEIIEEVKKAVVGKNAVVGKMLMVILAQGHILLEDIPGVGKTTLALAFSKAMALDYRRMQFTPDVMPTDVTGFSVYNKATGQLEYKPGAALCNLFLADEINRTSSKTQAALLEVMEEQQVTVDGITRKTGEPFIVIATENPAGSAGTQLLPESQLDRFMICVSMGYPTVEEEMEILRRSQEGGNRGRLAEKEVDPVLDAASLLVMREKAAGIFVHERIYRYIAELAKATRENEWTELGLSPRGTVALTAMAKACAWLKGREYVVPADVTEVFGCTAAHRIFLNMKARVGHIQREEVIRRVIEEVQQPSVRKRR